MFTTDWRDPQTDPPEEGSEVIVTLETGRVTSQRYWKGKFSTYTPVLCWTPLPPPGKKIEPVKQEEPQHAQEQSPKPRRRAVKRKQ